MTRRITIPVYLDTHRESFDFFLAGDIHYPVPGCEIDKFLGWRDDCAENYENGRKTYNALMGDYCSVYVDGDRRRAPSNRLPDPLKVYSKIRDWVRPLAKTNICTLTGNHDQDWWRKENIDFVSWMCAELGMNYGDYEAYVTFEIHREGSDNIDRYLDVALWHGDGGGRTRGGAVNASARPVEVHKTADIIAVGHTHRMGVIYEQWVAPSRTDKEKWIDKNQAIVMTGGFQKGYLEDRSTYISKKVLPPVCIGGVKLTITPFKGKHDMVNVVLQPVY